VLTRRCPVTWRVSEAEAARGITAKCTVCGRTFRDVREWEESRCPA
jgi:predicted Zn-ribbon and HTH transcriptional regulator